MNQLLKIAPLCGYNPAFPNLQFNYSMLQYPKGNDAFFKSYWIIISVFNQTSRQSLPNTLFINNGTYFDLYCMHSAKSSLSLLESKLPHLADKDVSLSAQTELLEESKLGFGSVEKEQVGHGKGKFGIGRMQRLPRNVQIWQYQGTVAICTVAAALAPWHCSFPKFKLEFAVVSTKLSLFLLLGLLWDWRNRNSWSPPQSALIPPAKVFLDFAFHSWEFIFLSASSGFHLHSENIENIPS